MEQVSQTITLVFGFTLAFAVGFEINRKRRQLRELYDVLDADDHATIAVLDDLVASGALQPWRPDFL